MAVSEHILTLDGGRDLAVLEMGSPQGQPVIYFHGAPGSNRERIADDVRFNENDLRVIAISRPGIGASSACSDWTALSFADDVVAVMDSLSIDKAVMVGFSAGGLYAAACANAHPEKVDKLVLLSSVAPIDNPDVYSLLKDNVRGFYDGARHAPDALLEQLSAAATSPEAVYGLVEASVQGSEADEVLFTTASFRDGLLRVYVDVLQQGLSGFVKDLSNVASPWGFSLDAIESGDVDVLLWQGKDDQNVPVEMGRYIADAIPSSDAHFVSGGHYFSYKHLPDILKQACNV